MVRDNTVSYDFRPRTCALDYSFGVPLLPGHFEQEELYSLDIDGDLLEPKLRNLKGASVRLYSATFDLKKSHSGELSRPIGSLERSKGHFAAYLFVPAETVRLAYWLVTDGTMERMLLFATPMEHLRAKVKMMAFNTHISTDEAPHEQ